MTKTDRRQLLETLAGRMDPATHREHIETQLKALKDQASRVMIVVRQLDEDPHTSEVEKSQLDQGYQQLESLSWRIEDLTDRLTALDDAHVASVTTLKAAGANRAARRRAEREGQKLEGEASEDLGDGADNGDN